MGILLNQLSQNCFSPFDYVKEAYTGKSYKLLDEEERCCYFVPNADANADVYISKEFNTRNYLALAAMIALLVPGILFGSVLAAISLLSKDIRTRRSIYLEPSKPTNHGSLSYTEVTRRIKNLDQLDRMLDSLPHQEWEINQLVEDLNSKNWDFKNQNYPYYALLALRENRISSHQFGTIMRYYSATLYHKKNEIQVVSLFNADGSKNPVAYQNIKQTLSLHDAGDYNNAMYRSRPPLISDAELDMLFEEMRKLPISEQHFFVIPDVQGIDPPQRPRFPFSMKFCGGDTWYLNQTISQSVMNETGFNVFNRIVDQGNQRRMIPSIGLVQTFSKVMYPNSYVKANPVIGLSSLEDIRQNGLDATRDIAVSFPWVPLPSTADNLKAPQEYDFSGHDDYHFWMASAIPHPWRQQMINIADIIQKYMIERDPENPGLKVLRAQFIDMENVPFRRDLRIAKYESNPETMAAILRSWNSLDGKLFWDSVYRKFSEIKAVPHLPKITPETEGELNRLIIEGVV